MKREFVAWTIYDHPRDFPNTYVARKFDLDHGPEPVPTGDFIVSPNLKSLRELLATKGLTPFIRSAADDPKIVETWL